MELRLFRLLKSLIYERRGKDVPERRGEIRKKGGENAIIASSLRSLGSPEACDDVNSLIAACGESRECLARLYETFKKSVFAVAYGITADYHLAEDCVAETFVRLAGAKKFSPTKGDGKGFILAIARNVALEYRRRFKRELSGGFESVPAPDRFSAVEDAAFVNGLLDRLNGKQRQIVVLHCCAELTFKQIARIMKSPESTVKSRYQKAISILQRKEDDDNNG